MMLRPPECLLAAAWDFYSCLPCCSAYFKLWWTNDSRVTTDHSTGHNYLALKTSTSSFRLALYSHVFSGFRLVASGSYAVCWLLPAVREPSFTPSVVYLGKKALGLRRCWKVHAVQSRAQPHPWSSSHHGDTKRFLSPESFYWIFFMICSFVPESFNFLGLLSR